MNSEKRQEKYNNILRETEVLRKAKKETISFFGKIARKNKILAYPVFAFTVLFIFVYNVALYVGIELKMREKVARAVAMLLVVSLVLTSVDVMAFALSGDEGTQYTVTAVEELADEVLNQEFPEGSTEEDINLPEELSVTVSYEKEVEVEDPVPETPAPEEPQDVSGAEGAAVAEEPVVTTHMETVTVTEDAVLPVEWKIDTDFSAVEDFSTAVAGDVVVYAPEFQEGYLVAEELELPGITVTITATGDVEDPEEPETPEEPENPEEPGEPEDPEIMEAEDVKITPVKASAVSLGNNGYPYGTSMNSSSITLNIEIASGTATSYCWQSSSDNSTWTDLSGQTAATATITPTNLTWYRCLVNGTASKSVETVYPNQDGRTWCKPYDSWYLSNGYMAYMYNGSCFDVTGLYEKDETSYMLCTSYNRRWYINGTLSKFLISFADSSNYSVLFTATLADGQTQFSFDCDTQLGNSSTSGSYYDCAALIAYLNNDNSLKQIAMMGAASEEAAADEDPAFVIAPVTSESKFWIGYYGSRAKWGYNTSGGTRYTTIGGENVVTAYEGGDSGMSMSWQGLTAGSTVSFTFGVGSVANTGAKKADVVPTSNSLTVPDSDTGCYYAVYKKGETTPVTEWKQGNGGDLLFDGLESNTEYVVRVITKAAYEKGNYDEDPEETDARTAIDPINPGDPEEPGEEVIPPAFTIKSRSITVAHINTAYTYNLVTTSDTNVYTSFLAPDADGNIVFSGLTPATTYYLIAKTSDNSFTDKVEKKTLPCVSFNALGHGTAPDTVYDIEYDSTFEAPTAPSEYGWCFMGWYKSSGLADSDLWNFETDTVSSNITLYAKWLPHAHIWQYSQESNQLLLAYCSTDDASGRCSVYAEDFTGANVVRVKVSSSDAAYTGSAYAGLTIHDTLTAADSDNNARVDTVYYTDAAYTTETTTDNGAAGNGQAPANIGTYYAKIVINGQGGQTFTLKTSFAITTATLKNVGLVIDPSSYVATGSEIEAQYTVKDGSRVLTEGVDYEVTEDSVVAATDVGTYTITIRGINNYTGAASKTWKIADATPPTGTIAVDGMTDSTVLVAEDAITFDSYFNSARTITISAEDLENEASLLTVGYYVTTLKLEESDLEGLASSSWTNLANGGSFTLTKDGSYLVYARIEDPSGNISYLSSQGFVIDKVAPVISGVKTGSKFCKDADLRAIDKGSGLASVLIDETESYVDGQIDYVITGTSSSETHKVVVTDKAGNSASVEKIALNVESEHEWKGETVIKESTCTQKGEKTTVCSKCGTMKHLEIDALGHDYDYSIEDDSNWDMDWVLKEEGEENVYYGTAYIYCSRGCKVKVAVTDTVTSSTLVKATVTEIDDETLQYSVTVHYMIDGAPASRVFTKTAKRNKLSSKVVAGENELSTELVVAEDAPQVTVEGLDDENAEGMLTQAEKAELEDADSGFTTKIKVYMEAKNVETLTDAEEENLRNVLEASLGAETGDLVTLDLSLYKQVTTKKSDGTGSELKKTEKLNEASESLQITIDTADFGFPTVKKGYKRVYAVSRDHDYSDAGDGSDVRTEVVFNGQASDGKIVVDSKLFCTYAVGYTDVKIKSSKPKDDPADDPSDDPSEDPTDGETVDDKTVEETEPATPASPKKTEPVSPDDETEEMGSGETVTDEKETAEVLAEMASADDTEKTEAASLDETKENAAAENAETAGTVENKTEKSCFTHWFYLLLLALYAAALFLLKKKGAKVVTGTVAVNAILGLILLIVGSCGLDLVFFIVELLAALAGAYFCLAKKKA